MTRIVFMGSPEFAVPVLRKLADHEHIVGVVTQPDRPAGRGRVLKSPPIKLLADELNLPVVQPRKLSEPDVMRPVAPMGSRFDRCGSFWSNPPTRGPGLTKVRLH